MSRFTTLFQLLILPLPWSLRRWLLVKFMKYEIHPSARIGVSLVRPVKLVMEEGSRIGHLTVAKGMEEIRLDRFATLGNLNWVSGFPINGERFFKAFPDRNPALHIQEHGAIVHRNLIDCTDQVTIGAFALLAGNRNQILTHSIDVRTANQSCAPVTIGRYCFIGTGTILLKGASLPDYCILAAGSVLGKAYHEPYRLLSGIPAAPVKQLDPDLAFFTRTKGKSD